MKEWTSSKKHISFKISSSSSRFCANYKQLDPFFPHQHGQVGAWSGSNRDKIWDLQSAEVLSTSVAMIWTDSSRQTLELLDVRIVIRGVAGLEPVGLRFSQVPWDSKFLNNLKIWLLFGNVLKLNHILYLAWTILKDLVPSYVFTHNIFLFIFLGNVLLYLLKYTKLSIISKR